MVQYQDRIMGLPAVPVVPKDPVAMTRTLCMPDGTLLTCRKRRNKEGKLYWTAEIPLEIAKDIYEED